MSFLFILSFFVSEVELETAQQQISLLTQQKELLRERLESTGDYPSLKRDKVELQGQLQLLKKQLEEAQEENRQLRAGEEQLLVTQTRHVFSNGVIWTF